MKLQEQSRLIELSTPKGLDRVLLHWYKDMGWLVEFWMGKDLTGRNRYIITKGWTIYGIFTAMKHVEKLAKEQCLFPEEMAIEKVINEVSMWTLDKWKELAKDASTEHPVIQKTRKLLEELSK